MGARGGDRSPNPNGRRRRGRGAVITERVVRMLAWLVVFLGMISVALYVVGEIASDRFVTSQFLSWIPTEAALAAALGALLAAILGWGAASLLGATDRACKRFRSAAAVATLATVVLTIALVTIEHRPWRPAPEIPEGSLSLLHWNPRWPNRARAVPVAETLYALLHDHPADLVILTDPGRLLFDGRAAELATSGWTVVRSGSFAVLTALPILELRALARFDRVDITLLRIDAAPLGMLPDPQRDEPHTLTLWLIDMPSDLRLGRMALAQQVRARLDDLGAPAPDLVVGDMNFTRRSAALKRLVPATRNAFSEAGRGLGSSFPEPWPFWHIDHVLVAEGLDTSDYLTIHTGASRHRAQYAVVRRRPPAGMRAGEAISIPTSDPTPAQPEGE